MNQQEEIAHYRAENQELREALKQTQELLRAALLRIEELEKRIDELETQKTPPPEFVKTNVKKPKAEEKKPRKKRDKEHNHGRVRAMPTQIVEHRIVACPDCHLRLGGLNHARVRGVMDIAPPPPVEVLHHRIFPGSTAPLQKSHETPLELHAEVLRQLRLRR